MNENLKYRVVENCNGFRIQILHETEVGFLWWKRTVLEWCDADFKGRAIVTNSNRVTRPTQTFGSLDQATSQIDQWKTKKTECSKLKYHYV